MGIRQLIIAINKMDGTKDSKYSEKNFLQIKKNMANLCKHIGFDIDNIQFIAYSGFTGQNLVNKYEDEDIYKINKMEWYKGKSLLESLDELKPPKRVFNEPLKISIFNFNKISGVGFVLEGKILSGRFNTKMELCIPLSLENSSIKKQKSESIEVHNSPIEEAVAGDIIGFNIKRISRWDIRDTKLVYTENNMDSIKKADNLRVKILIINKKVTIRIGSTFTFFCYTLNVPIKIIKIEYLIDGANKILGKEPKEIKNGEYAIIIINIQKKKRYRSITECFCQKYIENKILGSFVLFNPDLVAVGKIRDINVL